MGSLRHEPAIDGVFRRIRRRLAGWEEAPGIELALAADHNPECVDIHALDFPTADHLPSGDVEEIDLAKLPYSELFWASPACPAWTDAKGKKRYFDKSGTAGSAKSRRSATRPG
ncbi:DNA cytosine methyltransferase [Nocardia jinanensis]|uniref:DNA cytosine methyltransferase n=1 Tax=Nocardia jinanensis TaxID=382504 RepID=UPI0012E33FCC|nr:DNA cytosine methyltransferase [Nocardia jinanensis]